VSDWGGGISAPRVQLFAIASNGWPHNRPWYHQLMPISCHFRDCKTLVVLSLLVKVALYSSLLAGTQTFTFYLYQLMNCATLRGVRDAPCLQDKKAVLLQR